MAELQLAPQRKLARSLFKRLGFLESALLPPFNPLDKPSRKPSSVSKSPSMSRSFRVCGICSFFFLALLFFMFTLFYLDVVRLVSAPSYSRSGILLNVDAIRSLARLNAGFVYDEHNSLSITLSDDEASGSHSLPPSTIIAPLNQTSTIDSSLQIEDAEAIENQSIAIEDQSIANIINLPIQINHSNNAANASDLQKVDYNYLQHTNNLASQLHRNETHLAHLQENVIDKQNPLDRNDADAANNFSSIYKPTIEEVIDTEKDIDAEKNIGAAHERGDKECDFYEGKWVQDQSYPLYDSEDCPFIDSGFRCQENGRPDRDYLRWRWQPLRCDLPRFNAKEMLERLRGKRIVFVGDSIGRNQWESMLCMLAGGVKNKSRIYEANGQPITKHTGFLSFVFQDFDLRVEYYRSPFLVPHTRPPTHSPPIVRSTLLLDSMDWTSKFWLPAHLLIFNTGHWWSYEKTMRGGCYFQVRKHANTSMNLKEGFSRAMTTWRQWVSREVESTTTQVFFRSYAPVHFSNGTWKTGGQCHAEREPWPSDQTGFEEYWTNKHVESEVARLQAEASIVERRWVQVLDITGLSNYRKDAHSSIYHVPKEEPRPMHRQDCSHWCLPGLPDVWNELLLANLSPSHFPS